MDESKVLGEPSESNAPREGQPAANPINAEQVRRDLTQNLLRFFESHAEIRGSTGGSGGTPTGGGLGERLTAQAREFIDQVVETIQTEGGRTDGPRATGPQEHE